MMPTVPQDFIEQTAARLAELEAEVSSYADELAEKTLQLDAAEVLIREYKTKFPELG